MIAGDIISEIIKRMKFWGSRFPDATTSFISNTRGNSFYLIQNRGVLNEGQYDEIKKVYYQLINNIEELIDRLYDNGYVGDGCPEGNEFVEKLETTKRDIVDFFRHPDVGGAARVWDNVGF